MTEFRIVLPDQSFKVFTHAPTALEVAETIGARLAKETLGVRVNQDPEIKDLRFKLSDGDKIQLITTKSPESSEVIRHSAAHVMAQAVQRLWPEVKVTIGPVIENGFFYDFDSPFTFTEEHLERIEKEMQKIIDSNYPLIRREISQQDGIQIFQRLGERFKVEIIQDLALRHANNSSKPEALQSDSSKPEALGATEPTLTIYDQGDWFDLCRGPHVQSTGQIKAFKLLSVAGAYWRGDEKNPMLQRIYATAFGDKKELDQHLKNLEEAKKRDHRKLGRELGLFMFHELAPGSPFFTGKGAVIYNELQRLMRELYKDHGYQEVITPQFFDVNLFHQSGHYQNYRENMYFSKMEDRDFASKPMNCPSHCLMFAAERHSYRDLPLRMADFGRLHRFEKSGTLHGLTRVRTFCQDDAHIFCALEQLQSEIAAFMKLLNHVYQIMGMDNYKIFLSTRPEKRMGSDEVWDQAEGALKKALEQNNLQYTLNPGDGAFYGPKLDIMFVDALNRPWQLGTLQCDFNLPINFDLKYTGEDNQEHKPVMLHRAIFGTLERFIGVYLEHTAGHLPPWLCPTQVEILNVTDRVNDYCVELESGLRALGVRVHFDRRQEKLNYKIREAQLQKIPYMLIIGDQEAEKKLVSLRLRDGTNIQDLTREVLFAQIQKNLQSRSLHITLT